MAGAATLVVLAVVGFAWRLESQVRASAEQLKSQADKLSSLVLAFRIENPPT